MLPGPSDDVVISVPANPTVQINGAAGIVSINSLQSDDPVNISTGGTLAVTTTFSLTQNLTLSGGTVQGATILTSGGALLNITSGSFDGVTLASNLTLFDATLTLKNGLILSSGATLRLNSTNGAAVLTASGSQTIGGTGTIQFDGTGADVINGNGSTLTLGSDVTVKTGTNSGDLNPSGLINLGTISAQTSGQNITIISNTSFTNSGLLEAKNGATLDISTNMTGDIGALNAAGGVIHFTHTLKDSTLTAAQAANLTPSGATFDSVMLAGNLTLSDATLTLKNGLILSSGATLKLSSTNDTTVLSVAGSQTIGGIGTIQYDGPASSVINGNGSTLTLGPGITVKTGTNGGGLSPSGLINLGTISAQTNGQNITIINTNFLNSGLLEAKNGATLDISTKGNKITGGNSTIASCIRLAYAFAGGPPDSVARNCGRLQQAIGDHCFSFPLHFIGPAGLVAAKCF